MTDKFRDLMNIINEAIEIDDNAAPPSYEDKDAEHYDVLAKTGRFGKQAAGAIVMAKTTGRIMLCLRSAQVLEPYTWGNCGGAYSSDERAIDAARREVYEETGYTGQISMVPLMIFTDKAFRYSNFLAIVEDEFTPSLGWEADRAVWVSFGHWPKPLHFGMKALFDDAESVNVIRHYATMFDKGINVSESLDEDLDLPAGVDVAKAIGDAKAIEMDDDENATEMPAKAGQPMIKVPAASQSQKPPQGQKPPLQGSIQGKPAPNQGSKSLAAIKPQ